MKARDKYNTNYGEIPPHMHNLGIFTLFFEAAKFLVFPQLWQ